MRFLEIADVAAELDLQSWRSSGEVEAAELDRDSLEKLHARAQFFYRQAGARFGIGRSQELPRRRDADAAKDSFGLADVDLVGWKIDVRAKLLQLRFARVRIAFRRGKRRVRIAHIDRIQKRLRMQERGVVDVERDFTDREQWLFAVLCVIDADVARDEAAERIERQLAHGSFDPALA